MAQLKQDEWPADNERTTTESETIKREDPKRGTGNTGEPIDRADHTHEDSVINNVEPHEATD